MRVVCVCERVSESERVRARVCPSVVTQRRESRKCEVSHCEWWHCDATFCTTVDVHARVVEIEVHKSKQREDRRTASCTSPMPSGKILPISATEDGQGVQSDSSSDKIRREENSEEKEDRTTHVHTYGWYPEK